MTTLRWERCSRLAIIGAITATVVTLVLSLVLTARYEPSLAQAWDDVIAGPPTASNDAVRAQRAVAVPMVLLALTAGVATVGTAVHQARPHGLLAAAVGAGAAVVGTLASALTQGAVQWDQLALFAITVGQGLDGYWSAAFSDGVRFVLVDDTEVSQSTYRTVLVVHLAGPVVAIGGLLLSWRGPRQPQIAAPASNAAHAP